jgi:hypothetical protein
VANNNDPLILFNDAALHYKCLIEHPSGQKAISLTEQLILRTRPKNRICEIGGNMIERPDDYIFIPLLTSDEQDPLYRFNFMNIDRNNLGKWQARNEFIELCTIAKNESMWKNNVAHNYLDILISELE